MIDLLKLIKEEKEPVPISAKNVEEILNQIRKGNMVAQLTTQTRITRIDQKTLKKWEKNDWKILWADKNGKGVRMTSGNKSVYLFPGQMLGYWV